MQDIKQQTDDLAAAADSMIQSLPALAASCSPTGSLAHTNSGGSSTREISEKQPEVLLEGDTCVHESRGEAEAEIGCRQLRDLLDTHPLAPESIKQQLAEQATELQARHSALLRTLQAQHQYAHGSRPPGLTADESLLAGWLRRHLLNEAAAAGPAARLVVCKDSSLRRCRQPTAAHDGSARAAAVGAAGSSCTPSTLLDKMVLRMPRPTRQQLAAHDSWCVRTCPGRRASSSRQL